MSEPLLSVCLITYNHARYIKQAIDGVLMQKVNFSWELVIADDFSTDGTREIVLEYKEKYPEFIKLISHEKNVGAAQNFMDLISAPSSKYIAYFEGDDYWADPHKLQKQVDFLESHLDYTICFHPVKIINEKDDTIQHRYGGRGRKSYSFDDLIEGNFIPTCSVVFRNGILTHLPEWYPSLNSGDWAIYLLIAHQGGRVGQLDEVMAVYRIHHGSTWSTIKKVEQLEKGISDLIIMGNRLGFLKNAHCRKSLGNSYIKLGREYHRLNNKRKARNAAIQSIRYHLFAKKAGALCLLLELYVSRQR